MLQFFRTIRRDLLENSQFFKYLKYAVGEIVLVVIGILIALQINNWNEGRKLVDTERKYYSNLLTSLRKDSIELERIIEIQGKSISAQNKIIASKSFEITENLSRTEISDLIYDVYNGSYSFFPKYGTYNSLVASNGLDILRSDKIKSDLIDLYDYWCYRYENVDNVLDLKYHNELFPFLQREIGFFVNSEFEFDPIDLNRFNQSYHLLKLQCENLNPLTNHSIRQLKNIRLKVNELILEINDKIN